MYKEGMLNGSLMYRYLWPRVTTKHAWVQLPSSIVTDKLYKYKVWDYNDKKYTQRTQCSTLQLYQLQQCPQNRSQSEWVKRWEWLICSGYRSHHLKRPNISRSNLTWALWQIDLALETWIGTWYSKLKHGLALETMGGGGGPCGNMSRKRAWICQSFLKINHPPWC